LIAVKKNIVFYSCPECRARIAHEIDVKTTAFCHCGKWIKIKKGMWVSENDKRNIYNSRCRI